MSKKEKELKDAESKDLAVKEEAGELAVLDDYSDEGMEEITADDIVFPRVRIVQPTSKEGTPGKLLMTVVDQELDELQMVVIKLSKGRILFSTNLEEGALCGSNDRKVPDKRFKHEDGSFPYADSCIECVYGGTRTDCNLTYNFLCIKNDDGMPFIMSLRSTGYFPGQQLISNLKISTPKLKCHMEDILVTMKLVETKNAKGRFYVPKFSGYTLLKGKPWREDAQTYRSVTVTTDAGESAKKADDEEQPF